MKRLLAIDTSSKICSVALLSFDETSVNMDIESVKEDIVCLSKLDVKTHAKALMPTVQEILDMSDLEISDIDYYGIANGPGSFTGIRIGMGAVKGFVFEKNNKVLEVSSLEILARKIAKEKLINVDYIVSMIDAKNEQMYMGVYKINKGNETYLEYTLEKVYEGPNNLTEYINEIPEGNIYLVGDMVDNNQERIVEEIQKKNVGKEVFVENNEFQEANSIIEKFLEELKVKYESDINKYQEKLKTGDEILPNYMKKSQAERLKKD